MGEALSRLVERVDEVRARWETAPLVSRGLGPFDDVFGLDAMERLLLDGGLVASAVRLMHRGVELERAGFSAARERASSGAEPRLDGAEVLRRLATGTTVVLEEVQTHCPSVRDFTELVAAETGCATYTTAFLTPPGSSGAPCHYDLTSVFVRQIHGTKAWRIGAPVQPWPHRPWTADMRLTFEPVLEVVLRAGDCLYLPRGYLHVAETAEEPSLHLTIGLRPVTWAAVFARSMTGEPALRQALPFGFHTMSDADLRAELAARLRIAATYLEKMDASPVAALIRRHYAPQPAAQGTPHPLRAALAAGAPDPDEPAAPPTRT